MKKWIIANLKMYKTLDEVKLYNKQMKKLIKKSDFNVAVCPSFVYVKEMIDAYKGKILVGAQNCATEIEGAYTGEVSAKMIKSLGADIVIIGHSERRRYYGETNEIINKKIKQAVSSGLMPVVCLACDGVEGYQEDIKNQIKIMFEGVQIKDFLLAFEPVWAIGTGNAMSSTEIDGALREIKRVSKEVLGFEPAVLYGGSANIKNAESILKLENVDGLLVGGASKNPVEFAQMCKIHL